MRTSLTIILPCVLSLKKSASLNHIISSALKAPISPRVKSLMSMSQVPRDALMSAVEQIGVSVYTQLPTKDPSCAGEGCEDYADVPTNMEKRRLCAARVTGAPRRLLREARARAIPAASLT